MGELAYVREAKIWTEIHWRLRHTFTHEVSIYKQCKEAYTRDAEFDGTGYTFVMHKNHIKCCRTCHTLWLS